MSLLMIIGSDQTPAGAATARIQVGGAGTIGAIFTQDGVPVDPQNEEATVTITRDDGTVLVTDQATTRDDVGVYVYTLSGVLTEQLDWLHVTWTGTVDGFEQSQTGTVEVVGGFLFSLYAARQDSALKDTAKYSSEQIVEARSYAEEELERACGLAFVPRYGKTTVSGNGGTLITLPYRELRAVRSATLDGETLTTTDLLGGDSYVENRSGWTRGLNNVTVAYEHGLDDVPVAVSNAALMVARDYLIKGPVDPRAIQIPTEDGPISIATPGFQGKRFGLKEVDAVIDSYSVPSIA